MFYSLYLMIIAMIALVIFFYVFLPYIMLFLGIFGPVCIAIGVIKLRRERSRRA